METPDLKAAWDRSAVRLWVGLVLLYGLTLAGRHAGLVHGPLAWYLGDVLCLPLVLGLVLAVQRRSGRRPDWRLPWWHGLSAALAYGLYFEVLLPRWKAGPVADPLDALGYVVGWLVFERLFNRPRPTAAGAGPAPRSRRAAHPCSSCVRGC